LGGWGKDRRWEGEKVGRWGRVEIDAKKLRRWEKAEVGEKGFGIRRRPIGLDCDAAKDADFGLIDKYLDFQWCGRRAL
jgi:hypothetical protein